MLWGGLSLHGKPGVGLVKTIIPHVRLMSASYEHVCGSHIGILWATSEMMYVGPLWVLCRPAALTYSLVA